LAADLVGKGQFGRGMNPLQGSAAVERASKILIRGSVEGMITRCIELGELGKA
jgi:hypothetical protein